MRTKRKPIPTIGTINAVGTELDGVRVRVVETSREGLELLAELLEGRPGWAAGSRVRIGKDEFTHERTR